VKNKNLNFKNNINPNKIKNGSINKLNKKFEKVFIEVKKEIKNKNETLNVLNNKFKFNFKLKSLDKFKKFNTIAIIGMGGSILGAEAIYNFFQAKIKKKIYFFNDLDENKITNFKKKNILTKVLFIIISKSGNTIETLSNTFALNIIKKNTNNIILISEKNNNLLFLLSKRFNMFYVEHNPFIGGRYSVLSEVGAIPAYLMGINISKLRSKALECLNLKNKIFLKNSAIKLTQLINSKMNNNLIYLNYAPNLEKFLYWCQQLIAESLGKKGKGLLPMISNCPKDHHSLLQLYLDGPKDKLFYIFSLEQKNKEIINFNKSLKIKNFLNKKKLSTVKHAQKKALIKSLLKNKNMFREFRINSQNEETLGQLFSYFIIETIIVGKMLNINPFNQPAVEGVKSFTNQLLK
jgi:glucose-6-phosphate isomerase